MVKTLGIKFEVAGVKEAQAALNNYKNSLNQSLTLNKQAADKSLNQANRLSFQSSVKRPNKLIREEQAAPFKATRKKLTPPVPQRGEVLYDYFDNYQRAYQALINKKLGSAVNIYARPRANAAIGGFYDGIGSAAGGRVFNSVDNFVRKLAGKEEYRESVDLSQKTINLIGESIAKALFGDSSVKSSRNKTSQSQRDLNYQKSSQPIFQRESLIDKAIKEISMPFRTIQYSFFEGIGSNFGNRFAEGLNQVLNDDLDISFERKGQVTGKAVSYTATDGVDAFKQNVSAVGDNFNNFRYAVQDKNIDQVSANLNKLVKSVSKSITSIADSYLRGFRRGSVQLEALRKIESEVAKQENQAPDLTGIKKAFYTASGFAGEKGQRGYFMADQLRPYVNDQTAVIGAENTNTEVLSPSDKNPVLWGISALATLAKINLKGFNPDAVKLAAQVINALAANPELEEIELLGHSAGGFPVEETQQLLDLLGYGDRVKSKIIGTPRMLGDLDNPNTERIMGDNDFRIKPLEEALEYFGLANPTEKKAAGVKDHWWESYLDSDDFLEQALGSSLDKDKLKTQKKKRSPFKGKLIELENLHVKYVSTIYQDLEELVDELSIAPDRLIAKSRREKLRDRGGSELNRKLRDGDFKPINLKEGTETAVLVSGGYGGAKGRSGAVFAKGLNKLVDDGGKTQYVGVRNPFTDILDAEDVRNPDTRKILPKILEMFGKTHELGYNPDATEIAAQIMDLLSKNDKLKVKFAGYSGGAYVAEDVMELLKTQGADLSRVEVLGVGAPQLPGGIKNKEFRKILGKQDPVMGVNQLKDINNQVKKIIGFDIFPELMTRLQNVEGIDKHDLDLYVENSKEVQDFFYGHTPNSKELINSYSQIESLIDQANTASKSMEQISKDNTLDLPEKLNQLRNIQQQQINLLRQIHLLSKLSKSKGGGEYFERQRQNSAESLKGAGIIVEPVQETVPNVDQQVKDPWIDTSQTETEVIAERAARLAQEYKQYLQSISQKTKSDRNLISQIVARDFAASDSGKQKELLTFIKQNFSAKAKAYRAAVKAGQLQLAKEQGEDLIGLAASIKSLYGELANFDELDPEVQSSFKSYKGYVTSVENEVLSGTGGKGRIDQGLPDMFQAQVNLSEQDGENFAEGFINGILESLKAAREAGVQLIEAVDEGVRDAGEIQSPSKLAKRLGRWFAQGFGLGLSGENLEARGREVVTEAAEGVREQVGESFNASRFGWQRLQPHAASYPKADAANNIASLLDTGGAGIIKKIGEMLFNASNSEGANQTFEMIGQLGGKLIRLLVTFKLLKVAADAMGLGKLVEGFRNLPEEAIKSAIAVETLDNRIVKMSGSASQGAKNLAFITAEAKRLNLNLTNAKDNYSQVLKATRDSALEGFQTENIYTAFAATAKANGLDQTQEQELFRSVRSMIGKGVLSQEEVRQEIGEKLGDFEQALAEAYGVSKPQLNKMIESGSIRATEALPKVAAILKSKNDIYGDLNTGAVAAQKADNAIVSFRESVGSALLPLQKFGNNFLAGFFNNISAGLNTLKPLVNGFFLALLANLLRVQIFGQTVQKVLLGLTKLLWTFKGVLAVFAVEMALIAAAWAAWENVGKMLKDRFFPEVNKEIDQLTRGLKAYEQAIKDANGAQEDLSNNKLQLAEGFKLPENKAGDFIREAIGSDYLNLDSLVREPLNNLYLGYQDWVGNLTGQNPSKFRVFNPARENKEDQLKIDNSNLSMKGNQLLMKSQEAFTAAEEITKFDAEIAAIQSARLKLLPGDQDALKASLEEEKKINQERDKQLKIVTAYQQTLTSSTAVYKSRLENLEKRFLDGEISETTYSSEKNNLQGLLTDTEDQLKAVNNELSKVGTKLSEFQRRLQKGDQRVEGFLAQYDRALQQQKAGIIKQGLEDGSGTQVIQLEIEEATKQDLSRRLEVVKKELAVLEKDLRSPELDAATKRIKENLAKDNIPINESSLNDIIEKTTVNADKEAAQGLLSQLKKETQLAGLTEQMAQTLQSNRNALIDLNRSIQDYLFRIGQQIKEANLEAQKLISNLFYTNLKNKLLGAIAPGSNTFVSGIIDNVQNIIDQAGQVAQKIFGDKAAELGFESETRTLAMEMQDFLRQVKGASDALDEFAQKLKDNSEPSTTSSQPATDNLTALRRAIIGKESGTNFKAVNPHSGALGYGQVMPANVASWTKEALGRTLTPEQFLNDSLAQVEVINFKLNQMLQKELKEGYDLDTAVRRVASTWYSGQAENYNKTKARSYKGNKYPSDDSYTKDILSRFKAEKGGDSLAVSSKASNEGIALAKKALTWEGKHFKEGVSAMCAGFVRQVLKESGLNLPVTVNPYDAGKQPNNGELMARSFFGSDVGTVFKDKKQAQAGDLIGFFDTYQYGQKPGAITHVGIYTGNDQMVDRSTSSAPVRHRSIDTFGEGNYIFMRPNAYTPQGDTSKVAQAQNQELVVAKAKNLELTKQETEQLRQSLETEAKNKISLNQRQGKAGRQESDAGVLGVQDKIFGIKNQYGYQSATAELTNNFRSLKQQFIDADLDIASKITNTEDAILSITNSIPVLTEQIAKFKAIGTPEALAAASVQQSALDELNKTLPTMQGNLEKLKSFQAQIPGLQQQSEYFLRDQGIFKTEQEALTKANAILSQKATLTEARGTLQEKKQVRLEQEDLRLELEIKEIQLKLPEGVQRNTEILGAQRQSKVNKENIDFDSQLEELDIEKKLLDYQSGIDDKKAGFMSRFGLNFGAEKIKKQNAIKQENARFKKELQEAEKLYAGQPKLLEKFTQAARELNAVNLQGIEKEFKTLGNTVEDYFSSATQGFFTQFTTNFFDGKAQSDRAQLEERLRYAEEVVGLENQYREEPGKLAHLKNRARELNEQKLSGITQEFNIFGRAVGLAKQALLEFVKQLAQMAAQQAASQVISSILGSVLGSAAGAIGEGGKNFDGVKLNKAPKVKAFKADKGITVGDVENFNNGGSIKDRKVSDRLTNWMRGSFSGVANAWNAEGEGAQLGVFHTGEELLSRKTGEAGRYQALKQRLGFNPLEKLLGKREEVRGKRLHTSYLIPHTYSQGGTIGDVGANVLSSIGSTRPKVDLSGLQSGSRGQKAIANKSVTINTTVVTPNADSFRLNQDQLNQDLMERMRRGI